MILFDSNDVLLNVIMMFIVFVVFMMMIIMMVIMLIMIIFDNFPAGITNTLSTVCQS